MKAAFINQYGTAEQLIVGEQAKPDIHDTQVLVKVKASGVNPVDFHIRNGMIGDENQLPLILGWDCAGEIVQVGEAVTQFSLGDKVLAFTPIDQQGCNAEYVAVEAELLVHKPAALGFIEAAATPLAAVTAWQGLFHIGQLQAQQQVMVINAAGGVGSFAVQLAKAKGAKVIAVASRTKHECVSSLGADQVIDYNEISTVDRSDVVLCAKAGEALLKTAASAVKDGGQLVSTFDELPEQERVNFTRMWVVPNGQDLQEVVNLITSGKVKVQIDSVFGLDDIKKAHQRSESYQAVGKIVLEL